MESGGSVGVEMSTVARIHPCTTTMSAASCFTMKRGFQFRRSYVGLEKNAVFRASRFERVGRENFAVAFSGSVSEPFEVCVKASVTEKDKLGDCPFSQRVLLTLEEKNLPYIMKMVDLRNKPEWFLEINPEGSVPVIKLEEQWVSGSDVITEMLEERFPDPKLKAPSEKAAIGSKIFSAFIGFLKSKDPSDGTLKTLLTELTTFNEYLVDNGPFITGERICSADLSLGPKLYHMEVALGHYKQWSVPNTLPYVQSYMKAIFSLHSFAKTRPIPEDVISGWLPKVMG